MSTFMMMFTSDTTKLSSCALAAKVCPLSEFRIILTVISKSTAVFLQDDSLCPSYALLTTIHGAGYENIF
jgi:hypothetical protein